MWTRFTEAGSWRGEVLKPGCAAAQPGAAATLCNWTGEFTCCLLLLPLAACLVPLTRRMLQRCPWKKGIVLGMGKSSEDARYQRLGWKKNFRGNYLVVDSKDATMMMIPVQKLRELETTAMINSVWSEQLNLWR